MRLVAAISSALVLSACAVIEDADSTPKADHYVKLKSSAPGMAGAETSVYVRHVPAAATSSVPKADRVVLFVHGGTVPGSVVFDLQHSDYSWMRYFANAGYDTYAMEFTGYGHSTRPPPMDDPCNLSEQQQKPFIPDLIPAPCKPSASRPITTMESEWEEMDAVIEYLRKRHGVGKVSIVAWSRGGPRSSGYVLRHPDKVSRIFALAPDYGRTWSTDKPRAVVPMFAPLKRGPDPTPPPGCEGYHSPAIRDLAWNETVATDPMRERWKGALRQLPALNYGMNEELAKRVRTPFAMVTGALDTVVKPQAVREFYADLGSSDKVLVDLACASHFAMWEKNRMLVFKASLDWIRDGKIQGMSRGEMKMAY
jgi:pimeloyl-ACP methyl ester carboxylesterase